MRHLFLKRENESPQTQGAPEVSEGASLSSNPWQKSRPGFCPGKTHGSASFLVQEDQPISSALTDRAQSPDQQSHTSRPVM